MIKTTIARTKGGDSKALLTANLSGILADCGYCGLLKVAHQPTLPRYYKLNCQTNHEHTQLWNKAAINRREQYGLSF